ncbi:MAG: DUF4031 domain-containing protein [Actinobacteria bacterium]|nr:DUF4031 domain-containing protein [Actinomycetota bacterium]
MAILIDPPAWPAHGTLWSHLVSDSDYDELHAFAALLGVPRRGFDLDHYDVPASLYARAVALGAREVTAKDVVFSLRTAGLRVRGVERDAARPLRRRQYLVTEWALLGDAVGVAGAASGASGADPWRDLGESLIGRWNERHRRYHDERHLEDVLLALNHLGVRRERIEVETLLAAWFHDAVYLGAADGADERDSAGLAVASLSALGLDIGLTQRVGDLIVATAPGADVGDAAPPLAHLLDADLSIFASSPARYAEYTAAVREEYAHVPDADFAAGRSRILSAYLAQPAIYRTGAASELWEARARVNLEREILGFGQLSTDPRHSRNNSLEKKLTN